MQKDKRDIVWETTVQEEIVTMDVTTTVWLNPGETPPSHYGHGHHHKSTITSHIQSTVTVPAAPSSAPVESSSAAPVSTYVPPTPSSSYAAPSPSSVESAPTTSAYVPPPATSAPAPSSYSAPAPAPSSGGGSAPSGQTFTGDITYYTPGTGSCGGTNGPNDAIVALAEDMMAPHNGANPNTNILCNKMITISYGGQTAQAKIVDTCPGCAGADLDLSPSLFKVFADLTVGRVSGVKWSYD